MILAAGLSPAWQRIMQFERLSPGEVNRAARVVECASGKVLNVGRACHALGADVLSLCPIGGATGAAIAAEFARDELAARWVPTVAATRTCTTLLDIQQQIITELVENAAPLTTGEVEEFVAAFQTAATNAKFVVLTGSLPPPADREFYARLISLAPARVLLDARGPELLAALPHRPLLVKPNRAELEQTIGHGLADDNTLLAAMRQLNQLGAEWVLITQGAGPAWLSSSTETFRIDPPWLAQTVNPIGCGDCLTAGIAVGLAEGRTMRDAVVRGVAAAVQNAGELLPARLRRDELARLSALVNVAPQTAAARPAAT